MSRNSFVPSLLMLLVLATPTSAADDYAEPSDLTRRPELIGREILVDDRIRYFLESRRGLGYDEFFLRRTEVPFRLPARLKFNRAPTEPNARVRGTLRTEEGRLFFDVSAIELLPPDIDRLEKEVARLKPEEFPKKRAWALWAERRGKELNDIKLEARGLALEIEAFWLEADRPNADALAIRERNESRPIPPEMRNALAHRGLRSSFNIAASSDDLETLARQIETLLPRSSDFKAGSTLDSAILEAYAKDPAFAYREATESTRQTLDRRLLADAIQRSLEKQVEARPGDATKLAELAAKRLPDRPALASTLRQQALTEAESRVASMREAEVGALAASFRDQGEADRARRLYQVWLGDRRKNRLSPTDSEGRVVLAASYEKWLSDRATAAELLREALIIDPASKVVVDAYLRLGFRKGDSGWYDPTNPLDTPANANRAPGAPKDEGDSLKGLTRSQVRSRLGGKPDSVVRSATQGRCLEQWIYSNGKGTQVVNFLIEAGTMEPRATSYYSVQKTP